MLLELELELELEGPSSSEALRRKADRYNFYSCFTFFGACMCYLLAGMKLECETKEKWTLAGAIGNTADQQRFAAQGAATTAAMRKTMLDSSTGLFPTPHTATTAPGTRRSFRSGRASRPRRTGTG